MSHKLCHMAKGHNIFLREKLHRPAHILYHLTLAMEFRGQYRICVFWKIKLLQCINIV